MRQAFRTFLVLFLFAVISCKPSKELPKEGDENPNNRKPEITEFENLITFAGGLETAALLVAQGQLQSDITYVQLAMESIRQVSCQWGYDSYVKVPAIGNQLNGGAWVKGDKSPLDLNVSVTIQPNAPRRMDQLSVTSEIKVKSEPLLSVTDITEVKFKGSGVRILKSDDHKSSKFTGKGEMISKKFGKLSIEISNDWQSGKYFIEKSTIIKIFTQNNEKKWILKGQSKLDSGEKYQSYFLNNKTISEEQFYRYLSLFGSFAWIPSAAEAG